MTENETIAVRATVAGRVQGVGYRDAVRRRARELGALGWVRNEDDGTVRVHAEGPRDAVEALLGYLEQGPPGAAVDAVAVEPRKKPEGHEQFAIRGVPAGRFAVVERAPPGRGFELRLEVDGQMRCWAVPKEPSLEPSVKRMAIEGKMEPDSGTWDEGLYEQGGRVPWPEALGRGHAVFVLLGEKLRGGFALQRTRGEGEGAQWLLIKRRES